MTDKEFENLKLRIEAAINRLDSLQKLYRKETGRNYVLPIRREAKNDKQ